MARERSGLTQLEVYRTIKLSNKSLSRYENNATSPDPGTIKALIELYDVSADFIMGISDNMGHFQPRNRKPTINDAVLPDDTIQKLIQLSAEAKKKVVEYIDLLKVVEDVKLPHE
ncbi:helix-turn-helix transcriptional regulator [Eubacteriales bacterium mix99]